MGTTFIDAHCHVYNMNHLPMVTAMRRYGLLLNIGTLRLRGFAFDNRIRDYIVLSERDVSHIIARIVRELRESFEGVRGFQPPDEIVITPLIIDFGIEDWVRELEIQIEDTITGINRYIEIHPEVRIYPFLGVDPRRTNAIELVDTYVTRGTGTETLPNGSFAGVKVYPPLGLDVDAEFSSPDGRVRRFFEHCAARDLPITTHCTSGGFSSRRYGLFESYKASALCHPRKWRRILRAIPDLRVDFAHFGDFKGSWERTILSFMRRYPNVYSDMAVFSFFNLLRFGELGRMKRRATRGPAATRMIYGSDYYTVMPFACENAKRFLRMA
jgi:predicted TIM-barrel fold metal-dependent hydrolase